MRKLERKIGGKWSLKYKKSINCKQPNRDNTASMEEIEELENKNKNKNKNKK
jgi:hypothetical protein